MSNLLSELEAVVGEMGFDRPQCYARDSAYALIKKHHAEIAAAVRDAARYRWLRDLPDARAERAMCPTAEGGVVMHQGKGLDKAIDSGMSAREGQG